VRTILLPCCWSWSPTEVRLLDADHRVSNSASDLVESNTYSIVFEHVHLGPAPLQRPSRHSVAVRRRTPQPRRSHRRAAPDRRPVTDRSNIKYFDRPKLAAVLSLGVAAPAALRRSGLRSGQQLEGPERRRGEVSSSGPDDDRARLQVEAGALKHCVASGCITEATLLLEAIRGPETRG
jgi:hypothetical protein